MADFFEEGIRFGKCSAVAPHPLGRGRRVECQPRCIAARFSHVLRQVTDHMRSQEDPFDKTQQCALNGEIPRQIRCS